MSLPNEPHGRKTDHATREQQLTLAFQIDMAKLLLKRLGLHPDGKHLLRIFVMDVVSRPSREVCKSHEELADAMDATVPMVDKAVANLKAFDLILKVKGPSRKRKRGTTWKLSIAAVLDLAGVDLADESIHRGGGSSESQSTGEVDRERQSTREVDRVIRHLIVPMVRLVQTPMVPVVS